MKNKNMHNVEIRGTRDGDKTYILLFAVSEKEIKIILRVFFGYSITINKFEA